MKWLWLLLPAAVLWAIFNEPPLRFAVDYVDDAGRRCVTTNKQAGIVRCFDPGVDVRILPRGAR